MNELKFPQRHFGCISTSLDDGSTGSLELKIKTIESWKPAASKVRIFSQPTQIERGISFAKVATPKPTLKAIFEDFHLGIRAKGCLVLSPSNVSIRPISSELTDYAESKFMGISWAFYAYAQPGDLLPAVFGLTPSVIKILAVETPEDVVFVDGEWQKWLFKWLRTYMQSHRYFDATRLMLAKRQEIVEIDFCESPVINVYEKLGEAIPGVAICPPEVEKKKRGRPKKK